MLETLEQTNELKTVRVEKDTWILELPAELCSREGFAEGTLASLTTKPHKDSRRRNETNGTR